MTYADKIKELRKKLLISQEELAKILGVSFATINRWENGKFKPSIKARRQLREIFKKNNMEVDL